MLRVPLLSATLLLPLFLAPAAAGGVNSGTLRGVTRDAEGTPLGGVVVLAYNLEGKGNRSIVSDREGVYALENVAPGHYQLAAARAGFIAPPDTTVALEPGESLRVDITLASSPQPAAGSSRNAKAAVRDSSPNAASASLPLTGLERELLARLNVLEKRLAVLEARESNGGPAVAAANTAPAAASAPARTLALPPDIGTHPVAATEAHPSAAQTTAAPPLLVASVERPAVLKPPEKPAVASAPAQTEAAPAPQAPAKIEPFSDADWTWLNGNPRTKNIYWDSKFFTPEVRADITYTYDRNHPADHSMGGSSEIFRSSEVQVEQLGVGGDFHYDNVRARLMTQFGMYAETTPRNDASPGNGQWDLDTAYRYVSEAYGGYHFNVLHGINLDAGIFMSYIGLFSYYNFDNWAYQPSYVSSNTPWFFNGVRVQIFPTAHLKIEPWFINGWQSYGSANHRPGMGGQIKWTPKPWMNIISNNYGLGHDDLFIPNRGRIHTDNSLEIKYYDRPEAALDKLAFSLTGDMGCEFGGGVSCDTNTKGGPKQSFLGYMAYNRFWFKKDIFGLTLGGGASITRAATSSCFHPSTAKPPSPRPPILPTSPKTPATPSRPGIAPSLLIGCPSSTSPSAGSSPIGTRACPTGPAPAASRPPEATTASPRNTPA